MDKKLIRIVIFNLILLGLSTSYAASGEAGWWIFRRAQSTKPKAISVQVQVQSDLSAAFYNPSILGKIQGREIFVLTERGLAKDIFGGLLYGQPFGKASGIAIGAIYYNAGKETLYYIENGQEKERTVSIQKDLLGILSYGKKLSKNILLGANFKIANSNIAEVKSAKAFAGDLGILFFPAQFKGLAISGALQNFGFSTKFNKEERLPTGVWLGTSYTKELINSRLSFGIELPYIIKEKRALPSIGVEYNISQFAINLGYRFGQEDSKLQIGGGFNISNFYIGYSFIPATYLSHSHRINLGYRL